MSGNIALPFRLGPSGTVRTVEQGSDDYYISQLAVILMTERGENIFDPNIGIAGMAFDGFSKTLLDQQVSAYLPGIKVTNVSVKNTTDTTQDVVVSFEIVGGS